MKNVKNRIPFYSFFGEIVSTSTFRHSSITLTGTILNGVLGAVFYILAARFLGPAQFGLMSVVIITQTLVTDLGDLGVNTGLVNFLPRYLHSDWEKAKKFLKLALEVKVIVFVIILIFGLAFSDYIAINIFKKPELYRPLQIGMFGVGGLLLMSFSTQTLQAKQRFFAWSGIQVGTNVIRVIFILIFLALGYFSLHSALWVYMLVPFLGFVIGLFLISRGFLKAKNEWSVAREFFTYNKWVAAFTILAAISSRLDTFIATRLLSANDLGLYSAANQMVKAVPMIVSAMGTVIAPKMASLDSVHKLIQYLKKTQVMVLGLATLGAALTPVAVWLIPHLLGREYIASGPIFLLLFFAMLSFLISVPTHMAIIYYYSKPSFFLWLSILHFLIIAILGWFLTSKYGVVGAATTVLLGQVVNFVIPLLWVLRKISQTKA